VTIRQNIFRRVYYVRHYDCCRNRWDVFKWSEEVVDFPTFLLRIFLLSGVLRRSGWRGSFKRREHDFCGPDYFHELDRLGSRLAP